MNKGELNRILKGRGTLTPEESTKIRSLLREIIAQQDYIVIDWEGKNSSDVAKSAEVNAQLKNIYLSNPLALFSVIMKNYDTESGMCTVSGWYLGDGEIVIGFSDPSDDGNYKTITVEIV